MVKVSAIGTVLGTTCSCVGVLTRMEMKITNESDDEKHMTINQGEFVPAYFNDYQRQTTEDDSNIAGFNVLRIINNPMAAAMDREVKDQKARHVLIFDLGGGTFVVSVLTIEDNILKDKSTAGDAHSSGDDVDRRVMSHFLVESKDMATNAEVVNCLRMACEQAKRIQFRSVQASLEINNLFKQINFRGIIIKAHFEDLNTDLFCETMHLVKEVLRNAETGESQVHDVALVNSFTHNSEFQLLLQHCFNSNSVNHDKTVAYGAAIQFAILSSDQSLIEPGSLYFEHIYSTMLRKRSRYSSDGKHRAMPCRIHFERFLLNRKTSSDVMLSFSDLTDRHNRTLFNERKLFKTYLIMLSEYRKYQNQSEAVLNIDVLINILSYVPLSQWPELELVSKQFQQTVKILYKNLKSLDFSSFNIPSYSTLVSEQRVNGTFTKLMNTCTSLKSLTRFDNIVGIISSEHFDKLKGLKLLTVVGFKHCYFKVDDFSQFLTYSPQLQELSIRDCTLESKHLAEPENCLHSAFQTISGLNVLVLNGFNTTFTGTFLSYINAERMKRLDLCNSSFQTKHLLQLLERCSKVESLTLHGILSDSVLQRLPSLKSLKKLSLTNSSSHYTDYELILMLTLDGFDENLHELRLDKAINDHVLEAVIENMPYLESLELSLESNCFIAAICKLSKLKYLKSLTLQFASSFTPELVGIEQLAFENLQILKLCSINDNDQKLRVKYMENISSSMKNLRELTLVNIHLDWKLLEKWVETNFIPQLTHLTLQNCCDFNDDQTICLLANGCRNVRQLNLSYSGVNDSMVELLADNCNGLEHLTLTPNLAMTISVPSLLHLLNSLSTKRLRYLAIDDYLLRELTCEKKKFSQYKHLVRFDSCKR